MRIGNWLTRFLLGSSTYILFVSHGCVTPDVLQRSLILPVPCLLSVPLEKHKLHTATTLGTLATLGTTATAGRAGCGCTGCGRTDCGCAERAWVVGAAEVVGIGKLGEADGD